MAEPITFAAVALVVTDDEVRAVALEMLHREIDAIDSACSRFRDDSELSLLNAHKRPRARATTATGAERGTWPAAVTLHGG